MATKHLISKIGEIKSEQEWRVEIDNFWIWTELQNRYICNPRAKTNKRSFTKPKDAFERYARLLGLVEVSHEGVF